MFDEITNEINTPPDIASLTVDIPVPVMPDLSMPEQKSSGKDIFAAKERKAWDKTEEARCDFQYHLRLTRRASTNFITIWQKSVFGKTLTEIKSDDAMVPYFVENLLPVIHEMIGYNLSAGDWAIVTTPMRRHLERQILCKPSAEELALMPRCSQDSRPLYKIEGRNFASRIAEKLGEALGIPFYYDCAHCRSKQRVGAVYNANNIPIEHNVIVFDDFVTTGSTILAMKNLLHSLGKNPVFICGINNKL